MVRVSVGMLGLACTLSGGCKFGSPAGAVMTGTGDDDGGTAADDDDGDDGGTAADDDGDDGPDPATSGATSDEGNGPDTANDDADDSTGDPNPSAWWDDAWTLRAPLTITEAIAGPLSPGYSVTVTFDGTALLRAGQVLASGDDVRIVWQQGNSFTELSRRLLRIDTPNAAVWWKTQAEITETSGEYWLYYGNPAAADPPDTWVDSMAGNSPVYVAADDFEGHDVGSCPDGWTCPGGWRIEEVGNGLVYRGDDNDLEIAIAGKDSFTDVRVHARVRAPTGNECPAIITRYVDTENFAWTGYGCNAATVSVQVYDNGWNDLVQDFDDTVGEWQTLEVAWTGPIATLWQNNAWLGQASAGRLVPVEGRVGLSAEQGEAFFDDVIVRRYVDPEPTVTLGDAQTPP